MTDTKRGWAVEVHVHDNGRLPGQHPAWLKAVGDFARPWSHPQALAAARRHGSILAHTARDGPGPDISGRRAPDGDMDGDCYEVIEHRGSMEQDPQPIVTLVVRQVPFATQKYGGHESIRAAYDEQAVAHFQVKP